ncbi:MAG: hypothetical protein CMO01_21070 [Thalassobius sp.]|nr:hypothetical protein [Thalassovita sp.]
MEYQPVNCGFYDYFEAAITLKKKVSISYLNTIGELVTEEVTPIDLLIKNKEEFLVLADGKKIRLDQITEFDQAKNPSTSCSIK